MRGTERDKLNADKGEGWFSGMQTFVFTVGL